MSTTEARRLAAAKYMELGAAPIPVPDGKKRAVLDEWSNLRLTPEDIPEYWDNGQNVGLLCGEPSGWRVNVDLDVAEAIRMAGRFLEPTLTSGRRNNPDSHWWYLASGAETTKFKDVDSTMLLELRSNGCQTLVEPSTHPSGDKYIWHRESGLKPVKMDAAELVARCRELATATLVARHLPQIRDEATGDGGGRHDYAMALSGFLLRPGRLDEDLTLKILRAAWDAKGWPAERKKREAHRDLEGVVRDTMENLAAGEAVTGGPSLEDMAPGVVKRLCRWWGWDLSRANGQEPPRWEAPLPLPEGLPPVVAFDSAMLPAALSRWVADIAERMQVPPDYVACAVLVALASLVGRKFGIWPKCRDDWLVVANLWGLIVGRPAMLKSPALKEAMKPLERLAARARERFKQAEQDHDADLAEYEALQYAFRDEMKRAARSAVKSGDRSEFEKVMERQRGNEPPEEPTLRRYTTQDPTVEKLCELLRENPNGLLLFRDELSGWLRSLDKQGRESDRSLYLEAHSGLGSYEVDRIGRGSLYVPSLTVSILGSIQPGPLSRYVWQATQGEEGDDGLLQRFQVVCWPDPPGTWHNVDRWPDTTVKNRAFEVFEKLDELSAEDFGARADEEGAIPAIRFTAEAQEVFDGWREDLELRLRSGELVPALESHFAKFRSLMPSLALLFAAVDFVSGEDERGAVGKKQALQAVTWCAYLESHAYRLYAAAEDPDLERARALLGHIRSGDVEDGATARSVYRRQWSKLTTPKEVAGALEVLEAYGWVRVEVPKTGGRPTARVRLHPTLKGGRVS